MKKETITLIRGELDRVSVIEAIVHKQLWWIRGEQDQQAIPRGEVVMDGDTRRPETVRCVCWPAHRPAAMLSGSGPLDHLSGLHSGSCGCQI